MKTRKLAYFCAFSILCAAAYANSPWRVTQSGDEQVILGSGAADDDVDVDGTITNPSTSDCAIEVFALQNGLSYDWVSLNVIHPGNEWTMTTTTCKAVKIVRKETQQGDEASGTYDLDWSTT